MNHEDLAVLDHMNKEAEEKPVNQIQDNAIIPKDFSAIVRSVINEAQWQILMGRTPKHLIKTRPGKGRKTFSYVPHGYVTAVLNRAFGFDWDWEIVPQEGGRLFVYLERVVGEDYKGDELEMRPASVIVHGKLTVRIRGEDSSLIAEIVKTSTGEKECIRGMTHGGLIKSAESDAFKKAASRLGVALDLYWQDADEDYLFFSGEKDEQKQELVEWVEQLSANGVAQPEIARGLQEEFGLGYPDIAKAMGVAIPRVIAWCSDPR